jgi:hypothetical protein
VIAIVAAMHGINFRILFMETTINSGRGRTLLDCRCKTKCPSAVNRRKKEVISDLGCFAQNERNVFLLAWRCEVDVDLFYTLNQINSSSPLCSSRGVSEVDIQCFV